MKLKLDAIKTEERTFEEVEADVVATCAGEGTILFTGKSTKCDDGVRERWSMKKLMCNRGGASQEEKYLNTLDVGKGLIHGMGAR